MRVNFTSTGGKSGLHRPESTRDNIPSVNIDVLLILKIAKKGSTTPAGSRAIAPDGNFKGLFKRNKEKDTLWRVVGVTTNDYFSGAPIDTGDEFNLGTKYTREDAENDSLMLDSSALSAPLRIETIIR